MSASKISSTALLMNVISLTAITAPIVAEDGMYPMSELPRLNLVEKGIELTADQLFNPDQISLVDGICRVNGCTGSFVSDHGLIITNHHCAFDAIQKASTPQHDLLADGFSAETREQEISAPDYQVRITENWEWTRHTGDMRRQKGWGYRFSDIARVAFQIESRVATDKFHWIAEISRHQPTKTSHIGMRLCRIAQHQAMLW